MQGVKVIPNQDFRIIPENGVKIIKGKERYINCSNSKIEI